MKGIALPLTLLLVVTAVLAVEISSSGGSGGETSSDHGKSHLSTNHQDGNNKGHDGIKHHHHHEHRNRNKSRRHESRKDRRGRVDHRGRASSTGRGSPNPEDAEAELTQNQYDDLPDLDAPIDYNDPNFLGANPPDPYPDQPGILIPNPSGPPTGVQPIGPPQLVDYFE